MSSSQPVWGRVCRSLLLHRLSSRKNRYMQAPKPRCTSLQHVLGASVLSLNVGRCRNLAPWQEAKSWLCCQDDAAHQYISLLTASKLEATFWTHTQQSFSCESHDHKLENGNACSLPLHRLSSQENRCMQAPKPRCTSLQHVWGCLGRIRRRAWHRREWQMETSALFLPLHGIAFMRALRLILPADVHGWAFVAQRVGHLGSFLETAGVPAWCATELQEVRIKIQWTSCLTSIFLGGCLRS